MSRSGSCTLGGNHLNSSCSTSTLHSSSSTLVCGGGGGANTTSGANNGYSHLLNNGGYNSNVKGLQQHLHGSAAGGVPTQTSTSNNYMNNYSATGVISTGTSLVPMPPPPPVAMQLHNGSSTGGCNNSVVGGISSIDMMLNNGSLSTNLFGDGTLGNTTTAGTAAAMMPLLSSGNSSTACVGGEVPNIGIMLPSSSTTSNNAPSSCATGVWVTGSDAEAIRDGNNAKALGKNSNSSQQDPSSTSGFLSNNYYNGQYTYSNNFSSSSTAATSTAVELNQEGVQQQQQQGQQNYDSNQNSIQQQLYQQMMSSCNHSSLSSSVVLQVPPPLPSGTPGLTQSFSVSSATISVHPPPAQVSQQGQGAQQHQHPLLAVTNNSCTTSGTGTSSPDLDLVSAMRTLSATANSSTTTSTASPAPPFGMEQQMLSNTESIAGSNSNTSDVNSHDLVRQLISQRHQVSTTSLNSGMDPTLHPQDGPTTSQLQQGQGNNSCWATACSAPPGPGGNGQLHPHHLQQLIPLLSSEEANGAEFSIATLQQAEGGAHHQLPCSEQTGGAQPDLSRSRTATSSCSSGGAAGGLIPLLSTASTAGSALTIPQTSGAQQEQETGTASTSFAGRTGSLSGGAGSLNNNMNIQQANSNSSCSVASATNGMQATTPHSGEQPQPQSLLDLLTSQSQLGGTERNPLNPENAVLPPLPPEAF
ncbi:unnamed protein product [Amoebophrya sp. A25]|nr:unnamed protein product [Amoebophrya sp. A25]|eukprot:GSA25T00000232001.1